MFDKLITYLKRRKKHSYTQLWEMVYGDGWYEKGLIREHRLMVEAALHWRKAYEELKKGTSDNDKTLL